MQVNIKNLIDDGQCYQTVRELRWPDGIKYPSCASSQVIKRGFDDTELARQRYEYTSAPSRLRIGVADFGACWEASDPKEVSHAQKVRCAFVG